MRVRVGLLLSFVCGAAACAVPGSAMAGTLDQQQTIVSNAPPLNFGASLAQTFTPGVSGALDEVDLFTQVFGPPTIYLSVEIRDVNGGFPGSTVLATRNIPPSSVADFDFFPITFAPAVPVVAGTQYAIVAYSATPPLLPYAWYGSGSNVYPRGAEYQSSSTPPAAWSATPRDEAFKTYVVPLPQPTPAATSGPTGQRAAALAKCKKKKSKAKRKKCKENANALPV